MTLGMWQKAFNLEADENKTWEELAEIYKFFWRVECCSLMKNDC